MSGFLTSSIGKKVIMSLTGLFLVVFLLVHLGLNLLLLEGGKGDLYNLATHFMATNPVIKVMEPVLALGFILHIIYGSFLTLQNTKARPVKYHVNKQSANTSFSSRNMFILGGLIFIFIALHMTHFFAKLKFGHPGSVMVDGVEMHNSYKLVIHLLSQPLYAILYVLGAIFLGLHLTHGFWSGFQTLGLSNDIWRKRISAVGLIYALIVSGGFALIPIFIMVKNMV